MTSPKPGNSFDGDGADGFGSDIALGDAGAAGQKNQRARVCQFLRFIANQGFFVGNDRLCCDLPAALLAKLFESRTALVFVLASGRRGRSP